MIKSKYNSLIESQVFVDKLNILNNNLKKELENKKYIPTLLGNLFYDHEQMNPLFYNSPLLKECEEKRKRLSKACGMKTTMFEIGLNGGHSSLLSLMSNDKITVYSNDIAEFYPPCRNIHPEIYVPVAANTLKTFFKNRFNFIKGSCLSEVPKFVKENSEVELDIIHLDGDKRTYKEDFFNLKPLLKDESIVIFDDTQQPNVQKLVDDLVKQGYLHRTTEFPKMNESIKYRNEILIYKK